MERNVYELIHANCVDVLRAIPNKSVHCVVTDMPYGVGVDFGGYRDDAKNLKRLIEQELPEMRRVARLIAITPGVRYVALSRAYVYDRLVFRRRC